MASAGANLIFNLSSSNELIGKAQYTRRSLLGLRVQGASQGMFMHLVESMRQPQTPYLVEI